MFLGHDGVPVLWSMAREAALDEQRILVGETSRFQVMAFGLVPRTEHEADALVEVGRRDVGHGPTACAGASAGPLDNDADSIRFIEQTLAARPCGVAMVAGRRKTPSAHPRVFIAPPGQIPIADRQPRLREIDPCPFIVREPGTCKSMAEFFRQQRIAPRVTMEMSSNEAVGQAAVAGKGLSFLSPHTRGQALRSVLLRVLDLKGTPVMRTWHIVHPWSKRLLPTAEAGFCCVLKRAWAMPQAHDTPLLRWAD
jgi:hypothetical protein